MEYGTIVLMEKKQKKHRKKREKDSSEGDSAKTSKSIKEAKTGINNTSPKGVGDPLLNSMQQLYSPALPVNI